MFWRKENREEMVEEQDKKIDKIRHIEYTEQERKKVRKRVKSREKKRDMTKFIERKK